MGLPVIRVAGGLRDAGAARRGCLRADAGDLSIAAGGWMLRRRGANPPHTHSPWHTHGSLRFVMIVIIIVNTYDNALAGGRPASEH